MEQPLQSQPDEQTSLLTSSDGKDSSHTFDKVKKAVDTIGATGYMRTTSKAQRYTVIEHSKDDDNQEDFNSKLLHLRKYIKTETRGRKIARFLSKFKAYFPNKVGDPNSLERAWAYFEHVTLPRCYIKKEGNEDDKLERAGAGEADYVTELYSVWNTKEQDLGVFGIGIGVYFSTLRWFCIILFIAGLLNIPSIKFYMDEKGGYHNVLRDVPSVYLGSAVCSNTKWVECVDCIETDFGEDRIRINSVSGSVEYLKNMCEFDSLFHGFFDSVSMIFLLFSVWYLQFLQGKEIVKYDISEQTSQDYSIVVRNPPKNASDPNEWRTFFAELTDENRGPKIITIALNNGELLRLHCIHRKLMDKLGQRISPNIDYSFLKDVVKSSRNEEDMNILHEAESIESDIRKMRGEMEFHVSAVFATFETENEQRQVLKKFSTGLLVAFGLKAPPPSLPLFRNDTPLLVTEPGEPSSIRWIDLGVPMKDIIARVLVSNTAIIMLIVLCAIVIDKLRHESYVAIVISLINALIPQLSKIINGMEKHYNETMSQISLYIKISIFRWTNTAILITAITPFTSTLSTGNHNLLKTVINIFIAEVVTGPLLRLLDIPNTFKRHVLAPRSTSQIGMIRKFTGAKINMAERYTEATKIVFLCFYYSALLPKGYFLGSFALFVYYIIDKFCLFRTWGRMPHVDKQIAEVQRRFFLWIALIFLVVMSAYSYSGFPYDNLCAEDESNSIYRFCDQDMLSSLYFPPWPTYQTHDLKWMTNKQAKLVEYYSIIAVTVLVIGLSASFGRSLLEFCNSLFQGSYDIVGDDQNISFSEVPSIFAYIPQFEVKGFMFPLIACDITGINVDNIYWKNPNIPHKYYSIVNDVPDIKRDSNEAKLNYSIVKYYDTDS